MAYGDNKIIWQGACLWEISLDFSKKFILHLLSCFTYMTAITKE